MILMAAMVATVSCAQKGTVDFPSAPLQECVYGIDRTVFNVWAPGAEAVQVKLYESALEETAGISAKAVGVNGMPSAEITLKYT